MILTAQECARVRNEPEPRRFARRSGRPSHHCWCHSGPAELNQGSHSAGLENGGQGASGQDRKGNGLTVGECVQRILGRGGL